MSDIVVMISIDQFLLAHNDHRPVNPKLLADIAQNGIKTPLRVNKTVDGYHVVDGGHRLACCKQLGIKVVPCIVFDFTKPPYSNSL